MLISRTDKSWNRIVGYYFLLAIILLSWNALGSKPPVFLSIIYLCALLLPTFFNYRELFPLVIGTFYTLSHYNFTCSFMPELNYPYLVIIIIWLLICGRTTSTISSTFQNLILLFFALTTIVNIIVGGANNNMIFCCFTIYVFLRRIDISDSRTNTLFPYSFVIISLLLSIIFLVFRERFMNLQYGLDLGEDRVNWMDPNYWGGVIGMGFLVAFIKLINGDEERLNKVILLITTLISIIAIMLNASRGAVLAVAVASLFFILTTNIKTGYKLLYLILSLGFVYFMYNNQMLDVLINRVQMDDGTGSLRTVIWKQRINAFWENSSIIHILFGYGTMGARMLGYGSNTSSHSDFVGILSSFGILGFVIWITLLLLPLFQCHRVKKNKIASCLIYLGLCCFTLEPFTQGLLPYWYFWLYIVSESQYVEN